MRTTFEYAFYCRNSKVGKKGTAPIELSISINGIRKFINLPLKVNPTDFNKKRKPQHIEDYLASMRRMIDNAVVDIAKENQPLTHNNLKTYIQSGGVKSYTVKNWLDDFINLVKKDVGTNMSNEQYKRYIYVKDMVLEYLKPDAEITTFTPLVAQQMFSDINSKYVLSTAAGYLTKIKRMVKFALDNDKLPVNPFQNIKIRKGKPDITFLTDQQLSAIINANFDNQSLQQVKDLFVFLCGTGLSYIDAKNLKPTDIKYKNGVAYIEKPRHKTSNIYTAVILPFAREVGERYGYDFKVISNQKTNEYLKVIGNLLGIETKLHIHLARHQYGMLLLNSGVRLETVAKALGHANIQTTTRHYAKLLTGTIVEEIHSMVV